MTHYELTSWWRHQMETFSALLAICAGNSSVSGEFPAQRPVTRSFDVSLICPLNKRLSKHSWSWWFETLSRLFWRHRNDENIHTHSIRTHQHSPSANSQIHTVLYMIYELQDLWILWCDHPGMYNYFSYYSDVIMSAISSQITGVSIVCSNVYSGRRRSKKISKLRVTGLCEGNPSVTGRFPSQKASNTKNNSIWWRRHANAKW